MREVYVEPFDSLPPQDLIFIDEMGTNSTMTPTCGKSPRGRRLYEARPVQRGRLYTIIGALSLGGLLTAMTMEGGTTARVFAALVEHLLCPHLRPGHVVALDNLSAHKNLETRAMIEAKGARVVFLPPSHPDLNPIEAAWAKLKDTIKKHQPRSLDAIDQAVAKAIPTITDVVGWFEHCGIQARHTVEQCAIH